MGDHNNNKKKRKAKWREEKVNGHFVNHSRPLVFLCFFLLCVSVP